MGDHLPSLANQTFSAKEFSQAKNSITEDFFRVMAENIMKPPYLYPTMEDIYAQAQVVDEELRLWHRESFLSLGGKLVENELQHVPEDQVLIPTEAQLRTILHAEEERCPCCGKSA